MASCFCLFFLGRIEIGVRFSTLLLILSTLATTTTIQARCSVRGQAAATGLVQRTPGRMLTTWSSLAPVSTLRITTTFVATVSLFAASGGEREKYICFMTTATRALRILGVYICTVDFTNQKKE